MRPRPRILITRDAARSRVLAERLRAAGAAPVEVPLIQLESTGVPCPPPGPGEWLVFTSARAVQEVLAQGLAPELAAARVAAVGPATAKALSAAGRAPDLLPRQATGAALAAALIEAAGGALDGLRVIYPRAELVTPGVEEALRAAGARLEAPAVYRNVCPPEADAALAGLRVDVVALASGSAARRLAERWSPGARGAAIVAIGPSTAAACREVGLEVAAVASPHTTEGLVEAALRAAGL